MHYELSTDSKKFAQLVEAGRLSQARINGRAEASMQPGDTITFHSMPGNTASVDAIIVGASRFTSFRDLFMIVPPERFGLPRTITPDTAAENMLNKYNSRNEARLGVIALHLEVIS